MIKSKQISLFRYLLCLFFLSNVYSAYSQNKDSAYLECSYSFTGSVDSLNAEMPKKDLMILRIAKKYSEFYSYNTYRMDSVLKEEDKKGMLSIGALSKIKKMGKLGGLYHIFTDLKLNKVSYTEKIGSSSFEYSETVNMKWRVLNENKDSIILGYKVEKAICDYGGRKWIAWFSTDIPISAGPWKFKDLPGLIVEVCDDKGFFKFVMNSLTYLDPKQVISFNRYKQEKNIVTTKEDVLKLDYKFYTNPVGFMRENLGRSGLRLEGGDIIKPYIPMELF